MNELGNNNSLRIFTFMNTMVLLIMNMGSKLEFYWGTENILIHL